jgi:hypothetical protein
VSEKITLVSTVKNAAPYIEEFLASVTFQTRPPTRSSSSTEARRTARWGSSATPPASR